MVRNLTVVILFSLVFPAFSQNQDLPRKEIYLVPSTRDGNLTNDLKEAWEDLAQRYRKPHEPELPQQAPEVIKTAFDSAVEGAQVAFAGFPNQPKVTTKKDKVATIKDLEELFLYARGTRYLEDPTTPEFLRRIPWLFPIDGCFMRAYLTNRLLSKDFEQATGRAFVFGNLHVPSPEPGKTIKWWYHTAATLELDGIVYVIDVSIDPTRALTLEEWVNKQGVEFKTAKVSLCQSETYFPNQDCWGSKPDDEMAKDHIKKYLGEERNLVSKLNETVPGKTDQILGETPPWAPL